MNKSNILTKLSRAGLVIIFLSFLSGCPSPLLHVDTQDAKFKFRSVRSIENDNKSPLEHYLSLKGKRDNAFGVISGDWVLREPLRVELQVGLFDSKRFEFSHGAQGCLETDVNGTSLPDLEFNVICAQYTSGGLTIRGWDQHSSFSSPLGVVSLNGVKKVYLGLEHDLSLQTKFSYSLDGAIWQTLATKASDPDVSEWTVGIGGSLIPKKGEVGLDNFEIPWLGPFPAMSTASQLAREFTYLAILYANNACNYIDGYDPDFYAGDLAIEHSLAYSYQAQQQLATYAGSSDNSKAIDRAIKSLIKGDKDLNKAWAKIKDEKAKPALRSINKGSIDYGKSLVRYSDVDF